MSQHSYSPSQKCTYRLLRAALESILANDEGSESLRDEIAMSIILESPNTKWHASYEWGDSKEFIVRFWRTHA